MSHRLLIAIRPPAPVIDAMLALMDGIDNARWQDEAQLHLTLRFVGEVDTPTANDLADALGRIRFAPFDLTFRGVGHFERGPWPSAVWAGVAPSPELAALARKVERVCVTAGCADVTRRFMPHVTLARLNRSSGPVGAWVARHGGFACAPVRVDHFALYESILGTGGSAYTPVVRYPLR